MRAQISKLKKKIQLFGATNIHNIYLLLILLHIILLFAENMVLKFEGFEGRILLR